MPRCRLTIVAVLALLAAAAIPAQAAGPVEMVASHGGRALSAEKQARAVVYWTTQRMRAARAADQPEPARRLPVNGLSDQVGRSPTLIEGSTAGDTSIPAVDTTPTAYTYPFPFTRYAVERELARVAPYKAIGKIFFRSDGLDYVCSGASVVGGTRHAVFTAGHCLNDGGVWSTKVVFVPAYRNGARPYGTFAAKMLWVPTPWADASDFSYDMGAFDVGKNAAGKALRAAVGKLGFAYSLPRDVHWNSFGYPQASPFNGETLQVCQASHATDDLTTGLGGGPQTTAIGCDMTGGSSGGPWIFRLRGGNFLNGLNSYGYTGQPAAMYSPYFDATANSLRCAAGTGDGSATTC